MAANFDYKNLLTKYISLVSECSVFSFLLHESTGPDGYFSQEEVEEMMRIWKEANE